LDKPYSLPGVGRYATRITQNLEGVLLGRATPSPRVSSRAGQVSLPAFLHRLGTVG